MNIKRGGSREPKKPPLDPPLLGVHVTATVRLCDSEYHTIAVVCVCQYYSFTFTIEGIEMW